MKNKVKICQCCGQKMMIYRRAIRLPMLRVLRNLFFDNGKNFVKARLIRGYDGGGDFAKLRLWGFIAEGKDSLTWGITEHGIDFILGRVQAKKYIYIYNQTIQSEPDGEVNPLIWCWEIAPQEISKEIVLADAVAYPRNKSLQEDLFISR